jgi:hypothetical protein
LILGIDNLQNDISLAPQTQNDHMGASRLGDQKMHVVGAFVLFQSASTLNYYNKAYGCDYENATLILRIGNLQNDNYLATQTKNDHIGAYRLGDTNMHVVGALLLLKSAST